MAEKLMKAGKRKTAEQWSPVVGTTLMEALVADLTNVCRRHGGSI